MSKIGSVDSPYILEGTTANFEALVLTNSYKGPVLVNYWSPKAGPCLRLYPVLDKIIHDFAGKMLLININTDEQRAAAKEYGVTSLPTIKLFVDRKVVETVHGYKNESELRAILNKYIPGEADFILAKALDLNQAGDKDRSYQLLADASLQDAGNLRFPLTLAKLLIKDNELQKARDLLNHLPAAFKITEPVSDLIAHVSFLHAAEDPSDVETLEKELEQDVENPHLRFRIAAKKVIDDNYAGALEHLSVLLRRNSEYNDEIAHKGMCAILRLLDDQNPLKEKYRQEINRYMH